MSVVTIFATYVASLDCFWDDVVDYGAVVGPCGFYLLFAGEVGVGCSLFCRLGGYAQTWVFFVGVRSIEGVIFFRVYTMGDLVRAVGGWG